MKALILGSLLAITTAPIWSAEGDVARVGHRAPLIAGETSEGEHLTADSLKGKVVFVDFFATWCGPCMEEMPHVESEIWQKFGGEGLVVIAIGREHTVAELKKFKTSAHLTFTILADPKREIYAQYATQYIPRCYVIGKDGTIKYATMGWDPAEFAKLKAVLRAELQR